MGRGGGEVGRGGGGEEGRMGGGNEEGEVVDKDFEET